MIVTVVVGRWRRALVVLALAASGLATSACSSSLVDASHQDGYYWYKADGVGPIRALHNRGDSFTTACTISAKQAVPSSDNTGDWISGCVEAAEGGRLP
jgi:hypothetical protein